MLSARHYLGALLNLRPFFSWWFPICTEHTHIFFCFCISSPPSFLFIPSTHIFFLFLYFFPSYVVSSIHISCFWFCISSPGGFLFVPSTHKISVFVFLLLLNSNLYQAHTFFCFCFCISFHDGGFLFVLNTHIFSSFFSFSSASWFPAKDELGYSAKLDLMLIILFAELLHSSGCARCIIYFRLP